MAGMRALRFPTWSYALVFLGGLSVATIHAAPEEEIEVQSTFDHLPVDQRLALSARWDLGYYLFQMQEFAAAAGEFEKLRKALPDEPTLLALIGSCYTMSGRWEEGEKALLEAVK